MFQNEDISSHDSYLTVGLLASVWSLSAIRVHLMSLEKDPAFSSANWYREVVFPCGEPALPPASVTIASEKDSLDTTLWNHLGRVGPVPLFSGWDWLCSAVSLLCGSF